MTTVEDVLMAKGPDVIVAPPQATVLEAAQLMTKANVGSVIVREGGGILGIFTERDLLRKVVAAGRDPADTALQEVMSSPVKTCRLADGLLACAAVMRRDNIRHLAVVEEGRLVGLIGLRDVLAAQAEPAETAPMAG